MDDVVMPALRSELAQWGADAVLGEEIPQANRASRTWVGSARARDVVVKLTFDAPAFVEPGLRVAAYVQGATGVLTGHPLLTQDGCWTVALDVSEPWSWTLAVMDYVHGDPVVVFDGDVAAKAGELLGLVHAATGRPDVPNVPGNTLDWFATHPPLQGDPRVQRALAAIGDPGSDRILTHGVLYGDPSPELIRRGEHEPLALIDWGTPSRGPLMVDVATWHGHIGRHSEDPATADRFLNAYTDACLLQEWELGLLPTFRLFWESLT